MARINVSKELMDLGKRIKAYRLKAGLTAIQLGQATKLSKSTITELEYSVHSPVFFNFVKICNAINASPDSLLQTDDKASLILAIEDYALTANVALTDSFIAAILSKGK